MKAASFIALACLLFQSLPAIADYAFQRAHPVSLSVAQAVGAARFSLQSELQSSISNSVFTSQMDHSQAPADVQTLCVNIAMDDGLRDRPYLPQLPLWTGVYAVPADLRSVMISSLPKNMPATSGASSSFFRATDYNAANNGTFASGLTGWQTQGTVQSINGEAVLDDAPGGSLLFQLAPLQLGPCILEFDFRATMSGDIPQGMFLDTAFFSLYFSNDPGSFSIVDNQFDDAMALMDIDAMRLTLFQGLTSPSAKGGDWLHFTYSFNNTFGYAAPAFEIDNLNGTVGDSRLYVDNVVVSVVPEPGALGMMTMGMFVLMSRKRLRKKLLTRKHPFKTRIWPKRPLAVLYLMVSLLLAGPALGQAAMNNLSDHFAVVATNHVSTLNRMIGQITSSVDIELVNLGGRDVLSPLHAVVTFSTNGVTVKDALGGPSDPLYGAYYLDLSDRMTGNRLLNNSSVRFPLRFEHDRNVECRYTIVPRGDLSVPNAPVLSVSTQDIEVVRGGQMNISVNATDADGDAVELSTDPALTNSSFNATGGNPATGIFTFEPQAGQEGYYQIEFKARDPGGLYDTKTVQITVLASNRPPELGVVTPASVNEGERLVLDLDASDPDGDAVTVHSTSLPAHAVLASEVRKLYFTPDFTQAGVYDIPVVARDGALQSITRTAEVTVVDVPIPDPGDTNVLTMTVNPVETPTLRKSAYISGTINIGTNPPPVISSTSAIITGLNPANGRQGQTLDVALTGLGSGPFAVHFNPAASQPDFGSGTRVSNVRVLNATSLVVSVEMASNAVIGSRSVTVATSNELAVSVIGFSVTEGITTLTGRLIDPVTSNAIAGAVVSIQGTMLRTITGLDGSFALDNIPAGDQVLLINPPDHELIRIAVNGDSRQTVNLGILQPPKAVFDPAAPASVSLPSVLNRGISEVAGGLELTQIQNSIRDTMLLVGGDEAGVLDEYGNQLNPSLQGHGVVSLTPMGVRLIAQKMARGGETISLAELLFAFSYGYEWVGERYKLQQWIDKLQTIVNLAWSNPSDPESAIVVCIFNHSSHFTPEPPQVVPEMRLNPMQAFLFTSSLMAYSSLRESGLITQNNMPLWDESRFAATPKTCGDWFDAILDLLTPSASAQAPPPPGKRAFTGYWRNMFDGPAYLTKRVNLAVCSYMIVSAALALPVPTLAGAMTQTAILSPMLGTICDDMRGAFGVMALAVQVPEPPRILSAEAVCDDRAGDSPYVQIKFRRSVSHYQEGTFLYCVYRFSTPDAPRELVQMIPVNEANTADLRPQDFDKAYSTFNAVDKDPLPSVVDLQGNVTKAPAATWFYAITTVRVQNPAAVLDPTFLESTIPWWQFVNQKKPDGMLSLLYRSKQVLVGDYSAPALVTVSKGPPLNVGDIEVDRRNGDVYLSDVSGDPQAATTERPKFIRIKDGGTGDRSIFAYADFKAPGQRGLSIDKAGALYSDNSASDAQYGGRVFKFTSTAREFVGSLNYFSRDLMFANPVAAGPMDMGPGETMNSPEDVYVVDELARWVKRIPVQATWDPFRRVGQPWGGIPYQSVSADLEVQDNGTGHLLLQRIASAGLTAHVMCDRFYVPPGSTVTVTVAIQNPSMAPVTVVKPTEPAIDGEGQVFLVSGANPTPVTLMPGGAAQFVYVYQGAKPGVVRFITTAQGLDSGGHTVTSPEVRSAEVEVGSPLKITNFGATVPRTAPGSTVDVVMIVQNRGDATINSVTSTTAAVTVAMPDATGMVQQVGLPLPASLNLHAGESGTYTSRWRAVSRGKVAFLGLAAGVDSVSGDPVESARARSVELSITPLQISISAPLNVRLEEMFSVTLKVKNLGTAPVTSVTPTLRYVSGRAEFNTVSSPPVLASLSGGAEHDFVYTLKGTNSGVSILGGAATAIFEGQTFDSGEERITIGVGNNLSGYVRDVVLTVNANPSNSVDAILDDITHVITGVTVIAACPDGSEIRTISDSQGRYVLSLKGAGTYRVYALDPASALGYTRILMLGEQSETEHIYLPVSLLKRAEELVVSLQNMTMKAMDPEFLADPIPPFDAPDFFHFRYAGIVAPFNAYLAKFRQGYDTPLYKGVYRGSGRMPNEWDGLVRLTTQMAFTERRFQEIKIPAYVVVRGLVLALLTCEMGKTFFGSFDESYTAWIKNAKVWEFLKPSAKFLQYKFARLFAIMGGFFASKVLMTCPNIDRATKDRYLNGTFTLYFKFCRFLAAFKAKAMAGDLAFEVIFQVMVHGGTQFLLQNIYIDLVTQDALLDALRKAQNLDVQGDTRAILSQFQQHDSAITTDMNFKGKSIMDLAMVTAVLRGGGGLLELGKAGWNIDTHKIKKFEIQTGKGMVAFSALIKKVTSFILAVPNGLMAAEIWVLQPAKVCSTKQYIFTGNAAYINSGTVSQLECLMGMPVFKAEMGK
jgi:hypothetical protein